MRHLLAGLTLVASLAFGNPAFAIDVFAFRLQGTIIAVNPEAATLVLQDDFGQVRRSFQRVLNPVLLRDLKPGDRVEVLATESGLVAILRELPTPPRPMHP